MSGPRLYLAGLMGAGKSSVAERIAAWLGIEAVDVDGEVERAAGEPIRSLWDREGEAAFRAAEREAVERLVARQGPAVVALGGGTLQDAASRERLARWGTGVWLDAEPGTLAERVGGDDGRPLVDGGDVRSVLGRLRAERGPTYAGLPVRVGSGGRPVEAVAVEVLRATTEPETVEVAEGVHLGRNALAVAGERMVAAGMEPGGRVVVATDRTVRDLHGDALAAGLEAVGAEAEFERLAPGEAAKSVDGLEALWTALARAGTDRDGAVAGLGGGAVGDTVGLAAATFKRGVPLALFPTTLLAQVDAAIGGKNAIDFAGVKNLLGTFWFPRLVAIDPLCLLTLPGREWRAGWAEVVKTGLIGDPDLFALCAVEAEAIAGRRLDVVEEAVRRSAAVKAAVVAADPREAGRRRTLNLGHTLGHALEATAGDLLHGEAVAIGTVAAARWAEAEGVAEPGLADRVAAALSGLGLPVETPGGSDPDRLLERIAHDKKRSGGRLHVVLPKAPGAVEVVAMDPATLRTRVLEAVR